MVAHLRELSRSLRKAHKGCFLVFPDPLPVHYPVSGPTASCTCALPNTRNKAAHFIKGLGTFYIVRNFSSAVQNESSTPAKPTAGAKPPASAAKEETKASQEAEGAPQFDAEGPACDDEDSVSDVSSAGDLSDCPPALQEFVFTAPPPFPFTVNAEELHPSQVKAVINSLFETHMPPEGSGLYSEATRWCSKENLHGEESEEKWLQYPEPSVLWPNPLLHNHRLQPFTCAANAGLQLTKGTSDAHSGSTEKLEGAPNSSEIQKAEAAQGAEHMDRAQLRLNRLRLEQLWKYSSVHGVSWDEIDEVYLQFRRQQQQRQQRWEERKQQILEYAGVVCARRLRAQRMEFVKNAGVDLDALDGETREQLLVPRSLFRRTTRRLFYKWHDGYFAPWRPGGLQSVLKAHITLKMLQRETNERFMHLDQPSQAPRGEQNRSSPEKPDPSGSNSPEESPKGTQALKEKLQDILKLSYVQRPVGSQGSKQKKMKRKTRAAEKKTKEGVDAKGRVWDFTGVGERGCWPSVPVVKPARE